MEDNQFNNAADAAWSRKIAGLAIDALVRPRSSQPQISGKPQRLWQRRCTLGSPFAIALKRRSKVGRPRVGGSLRGP